MPRWKEHQCCEQLRCCNWKCRNGRLPTRYNQTPATRQGYFPLTAQMGRKKDRKRRITALDEKKGGGGQFDTSSATDWILTKSVQGEIIQKKHSKWIIHTQSGFTGPDQVDLYRLSDFNRVLKGFLILLQIVNCIIRCYQLLVITK